MKDQRSSRHLSLSLSLSYCFLPHSVLNAFSPYFHGESHSTDHKTVVGTLQSAMLVSEQHRSGLTRRVLRPAGKKRPCFYFPPSGADQLDNGHQIWATVTAFDSHWRPQGKQSVLAEEKKGVVSLVHSARQTSSHGGRVSLDGCVIFLFSKVKAAFMLVIQFH